MKQLLFGLLILGGLFAPRSWGQQNSPLMGAWKVTEVAPATGAKITNPQPGLYIFTRTHYSIMTVNGIKPRPRYEAGKATDAQKIAAFDTFTANSGTYTINGKTITTRPQVAKNPSVMSGQEDEYTFEITGNTLILTRPRGPGKGSKMTLLRAE